MAPRALPAGLIVALAFGAALFWRPTDPMPAPAETALPVPDDPFVVILPLADLSAGEHPLLADALLSDVTSFLAQASN